MMQWFFLSAMESRKNVTERDTSGNVGVTVQVKILWHKAGVSESRCVSDNNGMYSFKN